MPNYNWDADLRDHANSERIEPNVREYPSIEQLDDIQPKKIDLLGDMPNTYSAYVRDDIPVAFHSLERSLKHYFSDIPVPAKDHVRFMQVRIAGGKRAVLLWNQPLREGQAHLPVASLSGGKSFEFNKEKYSLPYYPMTIRNLNDSRNKVAKVFRPWPVLVDYTLTILAKHKRDLGYIQSHILPRFNPYAALMMSDGRIQGEVQLYYKGAAVTTEEEVGFDSDEMVSWEISFQADAWLPLPEVITPTVRGTVSVLKESCGSIPISRGINNV